jgi:hypothetical protein
MQAQAQYHQQQIPLSPTGFTQAAMIMQKVEHLQQM